MGKDCPRSGVPQRKRGVQDVPTGSGANGTAAPRRVPRHATRPARENAHGGMA